MVICVGPDGEAVPEQVTGTSGWTVTVDREIEYPDAEFEQALGYVVAEYGHLIEQPLTSIRLVRPGDPAMTGAAGLYIHQWQDQYSVLCVVSGGGVADYVNTLVHEMIHLKQHRERRLHSMSKQEAENEANLNARIAADRWAVHFARYADRTN